MGALRPMQNGKRLVYRFNYLNKRYKQRNRDKPLSHLQRRIAGAISVIQSQKANYSFGFDP